MGYRSDVRLITTKKGFTFMENQAKADSEIKEAIDWLEIKKEYANIKYMGWNDINSQAVDVIQNFTSELEDRNISYRLSIIGENLGDIQEYDYTAPKDEKKYIPYPSLNRSFDEADMEQQFGYYKHHIESHLDSEEMECDE